MSTNVSTRAGRAAVSLSALAAGDAFGARLLEPDGAQAVRGRVLPPGPWEWTDDTEMACSVYAVLYRCGRVDQDALVAGFAAHYDALRGYHRATDHLLRSVRAGGDWRALAPAQFGGAGSWGSGAAMRVAPLGAWFADDVAEAARQAALSARVTHTHPDGVAGAVAVAVAAAVAARGDPLGSHEFLDEVLDHVPSGTVREGVADARALLISADPCAVAAELGCGELIGARDTVPFALWTAAKHHDDFPGALWAAAAAGVRAGGDLDTTCAIVGGVVGTRLPGGRLPEEWRRRTEPLPEWVPV
ncbi:ADP-ribosylglycohydrolase [Nocardiopsis mwathae]|uniref:ADP-ribosylglycohydrolase n=1 Tax=Nocardiopsis mwathae TaxID=1472723 RepID=A0A7X0D536_9ACTN|nr:ADP-ribosylglycohydrolase family protein [Nocardiopsis mwathae]MBB6171785.1 ADP-ribosylglycohydrolase [Nocardiopsis mwathae]